MIMMDIKQRIQQLSAQLFSEVQACRHHLHRNPELSFHEYETAAFIQQKLTEYGIPFRKGIAGTGVVALIEGQNPGKRTVALRADIDALPIQEANTTAYASQNAGVMHACGHDVHTSCLLGAGKILHTLRDTFEGTVKLIFQPAEEKLPGGAKMMIAEGVLRDPDVHAIIGQHVFNPFPVGSVAFCFGTMMASTDEIYITVKGKGGHGAYPQDIIDPVMIAAQMLVALQQVVSRHISPFQPAVLTFGKVIANGATNVIPDTVQMEGTFRALDEQVRADAHIEIRRIAQHVAEGFGGSAEVRIEKGYPVLNNDNALAGRCFDRSVEYLGTDKVFTTTPRMGAEDFAFYSHEVPATFYRLGTGNPEKGITAQIHTPNFDIDERALETGMGLMAWHAIGELLAD